jgi:hypothetical protein
MLFKAINISAFLLLASQVHGKHDEFKVSSIETRKKHGVARSWGEIMPHRHAFPFYTSSIALGRSQGSRCVHLASSLHVHQRRRSSRQLQLGKCRWKVLPHAFAESAHPPILWKLVSFSDVINRLVQLLFTSLGYEQLTHASFLKL